jgi:hypothetical protein
VPLDLGQEKPEIKFLMHFFLDFILRLRKKQYLCIRFPEIKRREASKKRSLKDLR